MSKEQSFYRRFLRSSNPTRFKHAPRDIWTKANPILDVGEPAFVSDENALYIGNGVTEFNSQSPISNGSSGGGPTISFPTQDLVGYRGTSILYEIDPDIFYAIPPILTPTVEGDPDGCFSSFDVDLGISDPVGYLAVEKAGLYGIEFNLNMYIKPEADIESVDASSVTLMFSYGPYEADPDATGKWTETVSFTIGELEVAGTNWRLLKYSKPILNLQPGMSFRAWTLVETSKNNISTETGFKSFAVFKAFPLVLFS